MVSISHLLERFSNSSNASLARTADWINSQAVFGTFSEPSGSSCNDDDDAARDNPTSYDQQTRQSAGSNSRIDHLLNSTYRSTNTTPVIGANEEEGMCFVMGCQICETQTPAEQILARNQNLCGLRIMLRSAEDGGEGAWSDVGSDERGDGRRGFLKRKAKRITKFCGHLYDSVVRRWSSFSDKYVSKVWDWVP